MGHLSEHLNKLYVDTIVISYGIVTRVVRHY